MPCFHPLKGWQKENGGISFQRLTPYQDIKPNMTVPCGQCIGCRIDKKRQWATRLVHEASLHEDNCFITLTYNDKYLPTSGSLNKKHFQNFMKRLRKANPTKTNKTKNAIRYYHCGEYGEKNFRPHYHAILFNHDFPDKQKLDYKGNLSISEKLDQAWSLDKNNPETNLGYATVGEVTLESAAYVAGYVQKKVTGKNAKEYYERMFTEDIYDENNNIQHVVGELHNLQPEYSTMSRHPGIASEWFDKCHSDIYKDFVTIQGKKQKIPKYYDVKLHQLNPVLSAAIKEKRQENMQLMASEFTPERLAVKKQVLKARMAFFKKNKSIL